ncbi:Nif3-like dinuclear metal center hexameric protein [Thermococcus sp. GR7]|uniref:Nif3-like dinuclear metal center hexameric protein n=1 Tax=unclassified Thermococcus TaxID=2627626 RepID=UPI0014315989|nr:MULTISPECIES: Nif3-like dinuclear metal center hexameric protein [unclassified Thermococcus]NJE46034.1 Nif3-like dinuclear metal center hexameric protein [Thermococcus sp. GR7]NJE78528.1 Nif3-like dinuclear metal center hexameric protein [Thermococcus sp. GR4]NJF22231.1 Nif3-like dinuclear metal center hexameric protein [Thermococcus sp. GR5]
MVARDEIVAFLNEYLNINAFPDKSKNGLQVEGKEEVERIAFAVDTTLRTIERAARAKADMMIVHHGMIWGGIDYVTGVTYRRLKALFDAGINLYVAHVPLDAHPEVGNNVQLLKLLGLEPKEPFGEYGGVTIGYIGEFEETKPVEEVAQVLAEKLDTTVKTYEFGVREIRRVGAITGAGGFALEEAKRKNVDLFVLGEFTHANYLTALDLGISVAVAGHYKTETLGVKALMPLVKEKFDVEVFFIDEPTGL